MRKCDYNPSCGLLFQALGHNQSSFDLYFPRPVSDETKMRADASKDCLETHQNVTWLTIITILLTEGSHSDKIKYPTLLNVAFVHNVDDILSQLFTIFAMW